MDVHRSSTEFSVTLWLLMLGALTGAVEAQYHEVRLFYFRNKQYLSIRFVPEQLLDSLPWNFVQTFMVLRRKTQRNVLNVDFLQNHQQVEMIIHTKHWGVIWIYDINYGNISVQTFMIPRGQIPRGNWWSPDISSGVTSMSRFSFIQWIISTPLRWITTNYYYYSCSQEDQSWWLRWSGFSSRATSRSILFFFSFIHWPIS